MKDPMKTTRPLLGAALLSLLTISSLQESSAVSISRVFSHKRSLRTSLQTCTIGSDTAANSSCEYLTELDFEDDDYDDDECDDGFGDDSIHWATSPSFRGGAAAATNRQLHLPGLHSGWRRKKKQTNNNNKSRQRRQQQQLDQLQSIKQQKLRQFRKSFRQKQRSFQNSLYNLNSKYNPFFPRPPYNLWQMDTEPQIGKTTLTGKLFMLNILIFGLQTWNPQLTSMGAKRSDLLLEGRQLYRLLTPVFLHGGIGHLMANSYSLKSMGLNVERAFGGQRFMATYLVSGIVGNVVSAIQSPNPAVGASGAIFGLVGAYYTFLSRNQDLFGYSGQMQKNSILETIGMNLLLGMTNPMIDNWGHIGGFIGGVGMAYLIGPKLYVAKVPLSEDGNFGVGKVLIDRPTVMFRMPDFLGDGMVWVNDNVKQMGRRIETSVRGLFNGGEEMYLFDRDVNYSKTLGDINDGGTIYRTIKDDNVKLEGSNVNVSPTDGLRQDVTELDPTVSKDEREREYEQQQRRRLLQRQAQIQRLRRRTPRAGRSLRPQYGHLYR
ncbi:rhomboid family protein [Skeletonema marinoi]|uniref:Rhomboid family protein n=2 Tax=Skeletonema marinoi TaxID=267567 RepID=A0AAD8YFE0_9STRA|nr:rhomboid family protein [Skeletonema marinoi]